MTVQHQSYLELKKDVGEEFARKTLLYNLKSLKNNVRATARVMKCSHHIVYLAIEKRNEGNLKDSSHRPKREHPHHLEENKEQMIIHYRKKTKLGKRRLRYFIFQKELQETRHELEKKIETQRFEPVSSRDIEKMIMDLEKALLQASTGEIKKLLHLVVRRVDVHSPGFIEPYYRVPAVRIASGLAPRAGRC